jgi:hypothetical protein
MSSPYSSEARQYDCVFIGTSPISVLEASRQSAIGRTVLMIDKAQQIGGAWCPLDIFGVHDVENAIHYFLHDPRAFRFMKEVLGWDVCEARGKYREYCDLLGRSGKIRYDDYWGRFLTRVQSEGRGQSFVKKMSIAFWGLACSRGRRSMYIKGGAPEMIAKIKDLIQRFNIEVRLNLSVTQIVVERSEPRVCLKTSHPNEGAPIEVRSKKLFLTHGALLSSVKGTGKVVQLAKKIHPRPAVHLFVRDADDIPFRELVFNGHLTIKYVHDVTQYVKECDVLRASGRKVLVLGMQHNVAYHERIYQEILEDLKCHGMLGPGSELVDGKWTDVLLPSLDDSDLGLMEAQYGGVIECMKTENFARGIGLYADRWERAFQLGRG